MHESDSDEVWTPPSYSERPPSPEKQKKLHKCTYKGCPAVFSRPSRLANHLLSHKGERKYRCKETGCSKAYMSISHLKRHATLSHSPDPRNSNYPCPNYGCNMVLKTRDTLIKHCKRVHDKWFECHICRMTFSSEKQLKAHSRNRHNNQDSHRCEECNLVFARLGQFNRHKRRHRLHICPHLDCFFASQQYTILRRHVAQEHPRLLKCYHCGKEVKDKALLRKHVRVHLAEQGLLVDPPPSRSGTFVCCLCSTVLTTKGSLKRHHLLMHTSGPKPRKPVKTGPERAPRYDKGVPRYSTASLLSSLDIPPSLERELVTKVRHSTDDETSSRVLELVLNVLSSDSEPLSPN